MDYHYIDGDLPLRRVRGQRLIRVLGLLFFLAGPGKGFLALGGIVKNRLLEAVENDDLIMAVKDDGGLEEAIRSKHKVVFLLYGDILNIPQIVSRIHAKRKLAVVHLDLIEGLSPQEVSVDFIKKSANADGLISTRPKLIQRASEIGLPSILRFFLIDSLYLHNIKKSMERGKPDMVEILPGLAAGLIEEVKNTTSLPVIAGGLIRNREDYVQAMESGAVAVSTSSKELWKED